MRVFVIFGVIEFIDGDALVQSVDHATHMFEGQVDSYALNLGLDYLMPHYFDGEITFMQYHKETT
jgi:hypothetical protein